MADIGSLRNHPIHVIDELRRRYGRNILLNFSRYTYDRRRGIDERSSFQISISDVTAQWLRQELAKLKSGQELAIESRVGVNGVQRHILMLDFRGLSQSQGSTVKANLPIQDWECMRVYFSGRSFHAYFTLLATPREWVRFMGLALLCNTSKARVIDQRWIGHRLAAGYSALRWSCNSSHHEYYPKRVPPEHLNLSSVEKMRI